MMAVHGVVRTRRGGPAYSIFRRQIVSTYGDNRICVPPIVRKEITMLGKPLLFFSSYAPLFGLLAVRFEQRWLWISCAVLAVLGVGSLWLLLRLDARSSPGPHLVE